MKIYFLLFFSVLSITSLSAQDIYAVGAITDGFNDHSIAVYWKNGELIEVSDGTSEMHAVSIAVKNGDVYIIGEEFNTSPSITIKAILWKNGMKTLLAENANDSYTSSIHISDEDVLISGSIKNDSIWSAVLWKNDSIVPLSEGNFDTGGNDMLVHNEDVYVVGYQKPDSLTNAVMWKNGNMSELLPGEKESIAYSIHKHNDDIYITGAIEDEENETRTGFLWKNGDTTHLSSNPDLIGATEVLVSEGDIYVIELYSIYEPQFYTYSKLWKNGVVDTIFYDGINTGDLSRMTEYQGDIFIAGLTENIENDENIGAATIWKNKTPQNLVREDHYYSYTTNVFIDGSTKVVEKPQENSNQTLSIYPNPSSDVIYNMEENVIDLQIINNFGILVKTESLLSGEGMVISSLSDGIYFLKDKNSGKMKKLIKY